MVGILYRATNAFTVDPNREMHFYSLTFWFLFPVIFTILFLDFKNINVSEINKAFYSNLLIIACLIGFCNLAWQFYSCYQHKHYLWHIKYLFNNSENVLVNIPREDYQNHKFMRFDTCFGKLQKSVFLSDEYVVKKLLYPLEYDGTYSEFCYEKIDGTYYDEENDVVALQRAPLKVKTKYWDLTPIVEEFKKQGMLNSIENQQH